MHVNYFRSSTPHLKINKNKYYQTTPQKENIKLLQMSMI